MSLNRNLKEYWCPQCRQFSNVLIPLSPSRYFKRHQAKKEKEKEKEDTRWSSEFAAKWLDNTLKRGLLSGLREREHTEEESSSASSTSTHEEEQWMKQHLYVFGRQIESICKYRKLAIPSFMRLSSSLPSSSAPSSSADQERGQEDETASSPFSSVTSLFGSAFGGNSSEGDTKREERTVERRRKEELRMALYLCHLFSYDVAALDLALASMLPDGARVHQSSTMIPQLKPIQLNTLKDFCNVVASFTSSIDESDMLRCLALLSYSMGLSAPEPFSSCNHSVLQRMSLPVLCTNIFDAMVLCFVLRNALQAKDEEDELEEPLSAFSPILCLFYSCYVVQCLLCVYLQQASLGAVSPPPTSHRPTVAPLESLLSCYQHIALCFGDQNRTSSINAEELRQTVKRQCVPFLRQVFFFFQAWNDHPPVFLAHDSKLTASPSGEEEEEGNQEQEENTVEETFERLCEVLHLPSDLDDLFKTSPVAFHSIADDWIHRFLKEMLLERKAVVQDRLEDEKLHQHEMDIVLEEARIATEETQEEKEEDEEEQEQEEEDIKEQTQKKKEEETKGRTEVAEEEEEDFITFIQRYVNARKIFATQELALRPPIGLVKPPKLFQDLFHAYLHETCPRCGTVPKKAAVCLICADYLCAHSPCCTFDVGECFEHAVSCGGGTGMFLLVRTSGVLLISDEKACIWGSPYLDQFGEEDVSFRRGKPLRLEERVYNHLNNVFLNQRLDGEILRSDVSSLKQVQSARLW
ncbi:Bromodomain adjacent to zinc finger domain, 2A [Balamuthia mandrillaris]